MNIVWLEGIGLDELARIYLSPKAWSKSTREQAREELNRRVWARLAPIMEAQPLPLGRLAACHEQQRVS